MSEVECDFYEKYCLV